ncbi:MAG: FHA domain-containing protein [Akkermansia sp.]|nr:FHA domain-containing protein [Akkermansia sp.]MBR3695776.1 FHA domain-containing protein [Akkermansia sp.]MBR7108664.1 FHA domain-containing protein [Akkermansia sp.]
MPALVITVNNTKKGAILEATPGKVVIIGRDEACDIPLPEASGVSRQHCSITATGTDFILKDLGSTNGIYANAVKLEKDTPLKEGVKYTIGDAEFQVMGLSLIATPAPPQNKADSPAANKKEEKKEPRQESRTTTPKRKRHGKRSKKNKLPLHWLKKTLQKLNPVTRDLSSTGTGIIEILLVLLMTFYAGMALYSYLNGGSLLPPFLD